MSHAVALGDMLLHYHEYCNLFQVNPACTSLVHQTCINPPLKKKSPQQVYRYPFNPAKYINRKARLCGWQDTFKPELSIKSVKQTEGRASSCPSDIVNLLGLGLFSSVYVPLNM